jgi:hypothetical protein
MFRSRLARVFAMIFASIVIAGSTAAVTAGPASASSCIPGAIGGNDGQCYWVPSGSYMPAGYQYPFSCQLPFSTLTFGSTSQSDCREVAEPGSYAAKELYDGNGLFDPFYRVVFKLCAPGTYNLYTASQERPDGSSPCFNAPPGRYIPVSGATSVTEALPCPYGTFAPYPGGLASCYNPSPGYEPAANAAEQVLCSPGTTSLGGQGFCDWTPPGYYAPYSGQVTPYACAAGTYSPYYKATSCLLADVDHYVPASAASRQLPCPAGTYQPTPGSTSCIDNYVFVGFAQPVDETALNAAKAGRTIPLKWRVLGTDQNPVADLTNVTVKATTLTCANGLTPDAIEEYAAGESGVQNLGDGYYQWNWQTPTSYAKSCKTLTVNLGDGATHTAQFSFSK